MAAAIAARAVALKHAKAKQADLARGLELQQARDESEVQLVFDQIDGAGREPTGLLDRDQARVLVQLVIGAAAVDEDAFEMIFPHKTRRRAGSDGADDSVRTVNKADMLVGINNYRYYLDHREIICEMFEKHDENGDMKLGRDELRRAILDSEAAVRLRAVSNGINYVAPERDRREVLGFTLHLEPTERDLDRIFRECDRDEDGGLAKSEILPALELWAKIAEKRMQKGNGCCSVL